MKHRRLFKIMIVAVAIIFVSLIIQLSKGAYEMSYKQIIDGIFNRSLLCDTTYVPRNLFGDTICNAFNVEPPILTSVSNEALIIWNIRIPRLLIAICIGINLALAGCIFQSITKNEMSSAYTLGISQGSGLSMLIILIFAPGLYDWIPVLAMGGGIIAFLIIYSLAWSNGTSPVRLVLSGVIIGSISIAIQKGLFYFIQDIGIFQDVLSWTTGSLIGLSWQHFRMILPWTVIVSIICLKFYRPLNLLLLGDDNARALGMSVETWRIIFALVGILAASSAVSVAGLIGFVGLITPHIGRTLIGNDHKNLFPVCITLGASLLAMSDTISRIILKSGQIPVGIILNIVGGIFFIFLMKKQTQFRKL